MKLPGTTFIKRAVILALAVILFSGAQGQINQSVSATKFGEFNITATLKTVAGKYMLFIYVYKNNQPVLADSVLTDTAACQGFSFPAKQPFTGYFIFSKHARQAGKTYILTRQGDVAVIAGGTFWAAPKHKLLFIMAEKDNLNLLVYSLKDMKTVFEKFSCDEFIGWYYRKGTYFGKVIAECGQELKTEKEVSEWMHPVEIEQFDVKNHTLNEMHITDEQVEHARPLVKYAGCN